MKKQSLAAIVMAAIFTLVLSVSAGNRAVACINCNPSEAGSQGCICFCENYANDTANDDQYGNRPWEEQFWSCFDANGCDLDTFAAPADRERNLQKPQFKREPKPQPLRRNP